jgi:CheY-like chemotaxis protein
MPERRTSKRSRSSKNASTTTVDQKVPPRLVLIVDDDRGLATLVKRTLEEDADMRVHIVHTGLDAVSVAAERLPDVIVLDLGLPDVDGTDVCRTLRGRSRTAHIPIVIVSERATEQDRLTGFNLGADDYVTSRSLSPNCRPVYVSSFDARNHLRLVSTPTRAGTSKRISPTESLR